MSYEALHRLVRVLANASEIARFIYDGLGRRAQKITGGITRTYVYGADDILEERLSTGATIRYVHGPGVDRPLASVDDGGVSYFLADHLGSIVQVTNSSAVVTLTRQYDPYGNLLAGSTTSGYAFTGREWDSESALYYRTRYYDPSIGRFLSEDPIRFSGGLNFYTYVSNNPVSYTDPFGLILMPPPGFVGSSWDTLSNAVGQVSGALADLARNFDTLQNAGFQPGIDKYYHCMANCEASRRGAVGQFVAETYSEWRENIQQSIGQATTWRGIGDDPQECEADRVANKTGSRSDPHIPCSAVGGPFLQP